ncbi:MAG: VWA domain-containing protein [Deltaproteobacteria bacterium]|nr:VWA domain-containing protein [Deltaproteobacteria bacterium]
MRKPVMVLAVIAAASGPASGAGPDCEYPNVMFVVDKSRSMSDPVDASSTAGSKYQIALGAVERALAMYGDKVRFGLTMFPWAGECGQGRVFVPTDYGTAASIVSEMKNQAAQLDGATPIAGTLYALVSEPSLMDTSRRSFVLLLTDGTETCSPDYDGPTNAAATLRTAGSAVFVIGFGSAVDPETLEAIAAAGGTSAAEKTQNYHEADDAATLDAALVSMIEFATAEVCDGRDNDCNGAADDIAPKRCVALCGAAGEQLCEGGEWTECLDETGAVITASSAACKSGGSSGFGDSGCSCAVLTLE